MSRSWARRGQAEPLAALAAVLVLGIALSLYADALAFVEPAPTPGATADATLQAVRDAVHEDGAAVPARLSTAVQAGPAGHEVNASLVAGGERWAAGPAPPTEGARADARTAVRLDRWTVTPGRLEVVVWP